MIDTERLDYLKKYLRNKVGYVFPGACFSIITNDEVYTDCVGKAQIIPVVREMKKDSIFDLASLTKVVATATSIMKLVEEGEISLQDKVKEVLPDFQYDEIKIYHLLTHTSGLPAGKKFYEFCKNPKEIEDELYKIGPEYEPGRKVVYSDLGFMLLGLIIEKVAEPLDQFASKNIFKPLNMHDTCFNPPKEKLQRCVATEYQEKRGVIVGKVHDGNAYAMGGVSGHAGLFSTATDLGNFIKMILNGGCFEGKRILTFKSVNLMNRCHTEGLNERRGLGWQLKNPGGSMGDLVSDDVMYHTGFTGTSVLIDREQGFGFVLLTNRVHPTRENDKLLTYRSYINNIAASIVASR